MKRLRRAEKRVNEKLRVLGTAATATTRMTHESTTIS